MELKQNIHLLEGQLQLEPGALSGTGASRQPIGPLAGEDVAAALWGVGQILEHIDVGILVLDLNRQLVEYCILLIARSSDCAAPCS